MLTTPKFYLGALLCLAPSAFAQENLLRNGDFAQKTNTWSLPNTQKAATKIIEARVGNTLSALQLQITPVPGENPWAIVLRQKVDAAWKRGEPMRFRAWMRSPQSVKALMFLESAGPNHLKSLQKEVTLSPNWQEFEVSGTALADLATGEATTGFHLGYGAATVEVADVRLSKEIEGPVTPPGAAQSLLENGDFSAPLAGKWTPNGPAAPKLEAMTTGGPGATKTFLRATVATQADTRTWDSRLTAPVTPVAVAKGSVVGVRFWARSPQNGRVMAIFQESTDPFNKLVNQLAALTPEWKEFRFFATATKDLPALGSNFEFHLGFGSGNIDIANVRVENYGALPLGEVEAKVGAQTIDFWGGTQADPNWKKAALARIEKHRKGNLKLRIVDAAGKPVRGAKIKLTQTRSAFRFGSAVVAARLIDKESPDNLRYQQEVERLFNTVALENDLKWDNRNPRKTEQALEALKWLRARKIETRGHTLVWGSRRNLPADIALIWDDNEKLRAAVRNRVREQTLAFKGQVYVWDVVNEAVTNSELWEKLGWDEFAEMFKIAKSVDPNLRLAYNDYNIANENQSPLAFALQRKRVAELVKILQKAGAPVDIYGDQAHFGLPLTRPARIVEIWNESAKLGLPIEVTEFDAGIRDDKLHGEFVRDTMIAAFSVPQVESFIMWGFWEGAHWRAAESGAMFRRDWSKRPAQEAYEQLVLGDWRTNGEFQTDANGVVQTRGFAGDYEVRVESKGRIKIQSLKLPVDGASAQLKLS